MYKFVSKGNASEIYNRKRGNSRIMLYGLKHHTFLFLYNFSHQQTIISKLRLDLTLGVC